MFSETADVTELENGLRVVSEYVPSVRTVAVGVFVNAGSRYEAAREAGLTHFIEHMVFKGTERRSARDIALEIEARGGLLNAYTDKEYTCYYARVLAEDTAVVLDVLSDMLRRPLLAEDEINREKNVVIEEIRHVRDDPEDAVHDLLDSVIWRGHGLGRSIAGTPRSVASFTREQIQQFMRKHYEPGSIVLSAAGRIQHKRLVRFARRYFGDMEPQPIHRIHRPPTPRSAVVNRTRRCEQVAFCVGMPAFSYGDQRKYTLTVLDTVLGGAMSSRLFQEIREKRGLAYDIGSHFSGYRDTGLFTISGGTGLDTYGQVIELVHAEMKKVAAEGLTADELSQAKRRLRGLMVFGQESMAQRMLSVGKSMLLLDRVVPLDEVLEQIEAVTNDNIVSVGEEVFRDGNEAIVALGPFRRNGGVQ